MLPAESTGVRKTAQNRGNREPEKESASSLLFPRAVFFSVLLRSWLGLRRLAFVRCRLRVFDARVIQGDQSFAQRLFDNVQLGQGQAAFLELAVEQAFHEQIVDELAQTGRRRRREGAAGAFDRVGEHDDAVLAVLWFGARITEARL